ncbi:hypothetical protein GCM10017612_28930 [Novosphingobium resinovorum]|nr:hypothetical protein GCM10017612_28930 [Novosphingobium resinovorum]
MVAKRKLSPREITVEIGPAPGLLPLGDHKAFAYSRTVLGSPGKLRIYGDHIAIGRGRTVGTILIRAY